jgi:hypothetical protein
MHEMTAPAEVASTATDIGGVELFVDEAAVCEALSRTVPALVPKKIPRNGSR